MENQRLYTIIDRLNARGSDHTSDTASQLSDLSSYAPREVTHLHHPALPVTPKALKRPLQVARSLDNCYTSPNSCSCLCHSKGSAWSVRKNPMRLGVGNGGGLPRCVLGDLSPPVIHRPGLSVWHVGPQDGAKGDSAVLVKRLEDQIKGLQREINMPSQDATGLSQLTAGGGSSSSP